MRRISAARVRRSGTGSELQNEIRVRDPGLSSAERERLKELEREDRELRRANEILEKASADFALAKAGSELDRRPK